MNGISKAQNRNFRCVGRYFLMVVLTLVFANCLSTSAIAYENYSDGCDNAGCHEDFRSERNRLSKCLEHSFISVIILLQGKSLPFSNFVHLRNTVALHTGQ